MLLPSPKMERWKYTNLPAKIKFAGEDFSHAEIAFSGQAHVVQNLSTSLNPDWVQEALTSPPPGQERYGDMALWMAANDHAGAGYFIDIPAGENISDPLIMTVTGRAGKNAMPRLLIRVGRNASLSLIEYHMGQGAYWHNMMVRIILEEGAVMHHTRFQEQESESVLTHSSHIQQSRSTQYHVFAMTTGGSLTRNQIHAQLQGEGASCHISGVSMLSNKQHGDTTITIEHEAPHCESRQDFRTVLGGQATGVFQGKIHVHQAAQKTDGYQLSKALLLSSQATMNTKPELEIYADDVKCSHGTTAGMLDSQALFYLQSRGIPQARARALLVEAFVSETVSTIKQPDVATQVAHMIHHWLEDV